MIEESIKELRSFSRRMSIRTHATGSANTARLITSLKQPWLVAVDTDNGSRLLFFNLLLIRLPIFLQRSN